MTGQSGGAGRFAAVVLIMGLTACSGGGATLEAAPPPETPQRLATEPVAADAQACMAEALYFEAKGTGEDGMRAVAEVILNRVADPRFPSSVCGVVHDGCQFGYRCHGGPPPVTEPREQARAHAVAASMLRDGPSGMTRGALFFNAARAPLGWFASRTRVGQFGGNVFYR